MQIFDNYSEHLRKYSNRWIQTYYPVIYWLSWYDKFPNNIIQHKNSKTGLTVDNNPYHIKHKNKYYISDNLVKEEKAIQKNPKKYKSNNFGSNKENNQCDIHNNLVRISYLFLDNSFYKHIKFLLLYSHIGLKLKDNLHGIFRNLFHLEEFCKMPHQIKRILYCPRNSHRHIAYNFNQIKNKFYNFQ